VNQTGGWPLNLFLSKPASDPTGKRKIFRRSANASGGLHSSRHHFFSLFHYFIALFSAVCGPVMKWLSEIELAVLK